MERIHTARWVKWNAVCEDDMTPMMKQFLEMKERHNDSILFFRLGDFYEMFGDDARIAAKELDLVLTTRDKSQEDPDLRIPMCGIPYHSAENYIARLISKGYKVAICEQIEDPATAKGIVARDIVRIITPGTLMESSMLDENRPNYLSAVYIGDASAICFADLSTGDISVTEFADSQISHIENELSAFSPAEAIIGCNAEHQVFREKADKIKEHLANRLNSAVEQDNLRFGDSCEQVISDYFGSETCENLSSSAIKAAGALLSYIVDTQKTEISHFKTLRKNSDDSHMELDINTMRNLELAGSIRTGEKKGSLLWVLDKTKTPMGRRLIRTWVLRPLIKSAPIKRRQSAVAELVSDTVTRNELMLSLRHVGDLERLIGKIVYGNALSRDLKALSSSINVLPQLVDRLTQMKSNALSTISQVDVLLDLAALIDHNIKEDPPFSVREGGFINAGVDPEVDRLRNLLENSSAALTDVETREKERTGKKLKVGYNKVFGYYIEISRAASDDVPDDYIRKQTLANCERFITEELKELETELLTAKDKLSTLEYKLFEELRASIASQVERVQATAQLVAELDVYCSLAEVAVNNNYCLPEIDVSGVLDIKDGRHPTVEVMQQNTLFVPNDTFLDRDQNRTAIITGPNMAGKSTYMRQTALIVLMAQMGSFVPAKSAHMGIVDRVFTRIGASDDLSAGKSTFMVEMTEMADILNNATTESLLVLDEIGRGTSTYDGMSVARAIVEHCADKKKLGAKTMFATHYHELTVLENEISGVKNYNISAKKRGDEIIFLRKIVSGGADDSYGIEVAGLAGLPDGIIKRAKAVLKVLEDGGLVEYSSVSAEKEMSMTVSEQETGQLTMFEIGGNEIASKLSAIDINTITPIEAMNLLFELKKSL